MSISTFVNGLWHRLFFAGDEAAGIAAFNTEIAPDAVFDIDGKTGTRAEFFETIRDFHASNKIKLNSVEDLAVRDNVVAQISKLTITSGGGSVERTVVRIVKVEERGGKKVVTSLVEVHN